MIKLDISEKCQNCPEFECDCISLDKHIYDENVIYPDNFVLKRDFYIRCKNKEKCTIIQNYLLNGNGTRK